MDGSEESFDLTCSPCTRKNRNREATKYCVECQDYYCATCAEVHSDFPALSGHQLLGRPEFPTNGSQNLLSLPTERCVIHPAKILDMFCRSDDQIGCSVCMAFKHRSCADFVYIPEDIENIMNREDLAKTKEDMQTMMQRMGDMIQAKQTNLAEVEKDRIIALGNIKEFREVINNTLDELENSTRKEFEAKCKEIDDQIQAEVQTMNVVMMDMKACQQQLESAGKNQSQQFVWMKKGQQKISEADKLSKDVTKSSRHTIIEFEENRRFKTFLTELKVLGKVITKPNSKLVKVEQHESLYKVTNRQDYNIDIGRNQQSCSAFGSCMLTNGTLLLTDRYNNKLRHLDNSTFEEIDQCNLAAQPYAVCVISRLEVAIALKNNTIQMVSLENKLAPSRALKTNHVCYGLAFNDGEIIVSTEDDTVYVYGTSGSLIRTICSDQSGKKIFSDTRHIAVSDDGNKIYVADFDKGLVVLDRQGRVLSRFSDPELSRARCVCIDGSGNVFVYCYNSRKVVQIGASGNKLGVISGDITSVRSLCFDRSNSRMIVTREYSNTITILELA